MVGSPSGKVKLEIARPSLASPDKYDAIIRLDTGIPTSDLDSTATSLAQRFGLTTIDASFDWSGQSSVFLSAEPSSHLKPHKVLATIRGDVIYLLFGSCDPGGNIDKEWEYVVDNWQWSQ